MIKNKAILMKSVLTIAIAVMIVSMLPYKASYATSGSELDIVGGSGIIFCENTGEIIYEKNAHELVWPMSTTKILTVLLALENLSPDTKVTMTSVSAEEGGSILGVAEGEILTVENLIYATMIVSGNDTANALAIEMGGSLEGFSHMMNEKANELGMDNSNFVTPSGRVADSHYSTAYDMVLLASEAFGNAEFRKIMTATEYVIPATNKSEERVLENNYLEGFYDGFYGGKSGTYDYNKATYVGGYEKDELKLIFAVFDTTMPDRTEDMLKLLDYGVANVSKTVIEESGYITGKARVKLGAVRNVEGMVVDEVIAYLPEEATLGIVETKAVYDQLEAPISQGDKIGVLEVYVADELAYTYNIHAKEDVEKGWFTSYIGLSNNMAIGLLCSIILIVLLHIMRKIKIKANKKAKEKIRQEKIRKMAEKQLQIEKDREKRGWTI